MGRFTKANGALDVPSREGMVSRWVRIDEVSSYRRNEWRERSHDGEFNSNIIDPVGNAGKPGSLVLMELPSKDYKEYAYECMGGRESQLSGAALLRTTKDSRNRITEGASVEVSDRLPTEAEVRRAMRS